MKKLKYEQLLLNAMVMNTSIQTAELELQQQCPGEYRIVQKYDPIRMVIEFDVKFEDPRKELLWRLKYS